MTAKRVRGSVPCRPTVRTRGRRRAGTSDRSRADPDARRRCAPRRWRKGGSLASASDPPCLRVRTGIRPPASEVPCGCSSVTPAPTSMPVAASGDMASHADGYCLATGSRRRVPRAALRRCRPPTGRWTCFRNCGTSNGPRDIGLKVPAYARSRTPDSRRRGQRPLGRQVLTDARPFHAVLRATVGTCGRGVAGLWVIRSPAGWVPS